MAEKFDRSKFKGSKLSKIRETKEDAKKKDIQLLGGNRRAQFIKIEDGRNELRIMPAHNPETEPPYRPMRTSTLECELPEIKDGEETGKMIFQNRKIFIATQHGNENLRALGKDPVELYVSYVKTLSEGIEGKKERETFLQPITGFKSPKGWVWGILPSTNFVAYALKDNLLGRWEIWGNWIKTMDKITAAIEEEEESILDYDPFSDVDEGYPLVVKKEKNDKGKYEYTLDKLNPKKRQTWEEFCEENRVTEAQLNELLSKESLTELYVDCYYDTDFDMAVNGLQLFDKKEKFGIFENDEFLDELEEIQKICPVREKEEKEETKKEEKSTGRGKRGATKTEETKETTKEEDPEPDEEDMTEWPKVKAKKYLKAFIADNYEDEEYDAYLEEIEQLKLSELRKWCIQAEEKETLPQLEVATPDDEPEDKGVTPPEDTETEESETEEHDETGEKDELEKFTSRRRRRG
ncbi:MAG: hypothetical protein JJE07_13930 [Flavobacteriaceae bacterium]|nr:hypothetical protein [Flavobacteriaceae bacterium]